MLLTGQNIISRIYFNYVNSVLSFELLQLLRTVPLFKKVSCIKSNISVGKVFLSFVYSLILGSAGIAILLFPFLFSSIASLFMNWPVIHRRKSNQEISAEKLGKNGEKKELVHRTLIFGIKSLMNHYSSINL